MKPKIVLWDLETFGFDFRADKGFILCGSYRELGGPIHTISRKNLGRDMWNDKEVCKRLYDVLVKADMWVTHNGRRFDIPFLNTRLLKHNLAPLPPVPHFDTCEVIWKRLKMSARLENVQKFFKFRSKKTDLWLETWAKAAAGNVKALKYVINHCEADIRVLAAGYKKLRVLGYRYPNMAALFEDNQRCPYCGKTNTSQRRGWNLAKVRRSQRFQCRACRGWYAGKPEKIGKGIVVRPIEGRP